MKYLGIYAHINPKAKRMFGELNDVLFNLVSKGPKFGLGVFVFDEGGYKGLGKPVTGYSIKDGKWIESQFPFPQVIYNRHLDYLLSPRGLKIKKELEGSKTPFFNEHYGHKLEVHQKLEGRRIFADKVHFPWTEFYRGKSQLREAIKKFPELYLKPKAGTQGKGIIKIDTKNKRVFYRENSSVFADIESLISFVDNRVSKNFLIQEGILTKKVNGRLVDIRVLVQHNGSKWEVLATMARIGAKGKHVANIHQGGSALSYEDLLRKIDLPSMDTISQAGISIAEILSRDANIAELGLDFLADVKGRICFIEANPRPGRRLLRLLGKDNIREKSLEYLLRYAKSLV